ARMLARLDHPNIVRVYDVGLVDDRTYIVTEYVVGRSLHTVASGGPMAGGQVADIGVGVARALDATHRAGIVHRDLKPANILISEAGIPRLLDYGIADAGEPTGITLDGQVVGTPRYLSPEQAVGQRVGPATDIYSLGLVLLECLTGAPAFEGSMAESLAARLTRDPPVPEALGPQWLDLLRGMTARDPGARPDAAGAADALARLAMPSAGGEPTTVLAVAVAAPTAVQVALAPPADVAPVEASRPKQGRRWGVAMAVLLAALLVAGAWAVGSALTAGEGPATPASTTTTSPPPTTVRTTATTTVVTTRVAPTTTVPAKKGRPPKDHQSGGG
ncbi:MAG TPA: serine/threonine-protein kinase, partial [Acidimicrobiales bacterium]